MIYHFTLPWVVLDRDTMTLVKDRTDGVLIDRDGNEVAVMTPMGVPTKISTSPVGTTLSFNAPVSMGRARFGNVEAAVFADENLDAAERAEAALAAAREVVEHVQWIGENATEVSYFRRDANGDVWVTEHPVIDGTGGKPRITTDRDVVITFP